MASRKVDESQKKEILELFRNGTKIKDLSKIFNFTIPTITRQLKTLISNEEFINIKNQKFDNKDLSSKDSKSNKYEVLTKKTLASKTNSNSESIKENISIHDSDISQKDYVNSLDSVFVELEPINYEIDNKSQKDLSSVDILDAEFPKMVYLIVDKKIELETKFLRDFPDWQFMSEVDLMRKTIRIYNDLKSAKRDCNKDQKVVKVPNSNVFKIVAPILVARGISRIVSDNQLIAL